MSGPHQQERTGWIARNPGGYLLVFTVRRTREDCWDVILTDLQPATRPKYSREQFRRMGYRVVKCVITTDPDITEAR